MGGLNEKERLPAADNGSGSRSPTISSSASLPRPIAVDDDIANALTLHSERLHRGREGIIACKGKPGFGYHPRRSRTGSPALPGEKAMQVRRGKRDSFAGIRLGAYEVISFGAGGMGEAHLVFPARWR
jgi:hypothetical protein